MRQAQAQAQSRSYLAPSLSVGLHLLVLTAGIVAWPWLKTPVKIVQVTPVTVISTGPITDVSAAIQADRPLDAATESPVPDAPPQVQPAPPMPSVTPPSPATNQTPSPPVPTKTAPAAKPVTPSLVKPSVQKPPPGLDLDALANSVRAVTPQPKRPSSAAKGPSQSQTDLVMRPAVGAGRGASVDIMQAISARLARRWNPNCGVEGAANIVVKVRLTLSPSGRLIRANLVDEQRVLQSGDAVLQAAGTRALTAVARAAPYAELPAETYADWKSFVVSFDARQICRGY